MAYLRMQAKVNASCVQLESLEAQLSNLHTTGVIDGFSETLPGCTYVAKLQPIPGCLYVSMFSRIQSKAGAADGRDHLEDEERVPWSTSMLGILTCRRAVSISRASGSVILWSLAFILRYIYMYIHTGSSNCLGKVGSFIDGLGEASVGGFI